MSECTIIGRNIGRGCCGTRPVASRHNNCIRDDHYKILIDVGKATTTHHIIGTDSQHQDGHIGCISHRTWMRIDKTYGGVGRESNSC